MFEDINVEQELGSFFKLVEEERSRKKKWNSLFETPDLSNELVNIVDSLTPQPLFESKKIKKVKKKKPVILEDIQVPQEVQQEPDLISKSIAYIKENPQEKLVEQKETGELKLIKDLVYKLVRDINVQGGGGEVRLEFLDDVNRNSAKVNNKFLKYNSSTGKWEGSNAGGGGSVFFATTYVTSSTYTITENDYYIGVNYAGSVNITLPSGISEGSTYVVKDELGQASKGTNRYITILPSGSDTIDGQNRAILAYDYGSLTFLYRNGWRVV